jgi:hypothetical protein
LVDAGRTLPLEMLPIGQFDIVYRSPLDVRSGELPVLPLSIYGALAMSHGPEGPDSAAADEFFIYKFDRCSDTTEMSSLPMIFFDTHRQLGAASHIRSPHALQAVVRAGRAELRRGRLWRLWLCYSGQDR